MDLGVTYDEEKLKKIDEENSLPEGRYKGQIKSSDVVDNPTNGNTNLRLRLLITEPAEFSGREHSVFIVLRSSNPVAVKNGERKIKELLDAVMPPLNIPFSDSDQVLGKEIAFRLRRQTGSDGKEYLNSFFIQRGIAISSPSAAFSKLGGDSKEKEAVSQPGKMPWD